MDVTKFEPYIYDPVALIDPDQAVDNLLLSYGLTSGDVSDLPLSAFSNYTPSRDNLNIFTQQTGVSKFIGNRLIYVSGGSTESQYTTGVLVTPDHPYRNLLNRYHPTANTSDFTTRVTREQLGGLSLPNRVAVMTYMSVSPRPRILAERVEPGRLYVLADPQMYGAGSGATACMEHVLPIDHDENVYWLKKPSAYIATAGRIHHTRNIPSFFNYTSTELILGAPKYGVSKFTTNFDFFSGSLSGDVWSNQDVYPLIEANKFTINSRQNDMVTDVCDSPYRWRTDVYGNEYMLFKLGTQYPKRATGGSDTDDDGRDDEFLPLNGAPDYYVSTIGLDGEFTGDTTGNVSFGGGSFFGGTQGDGEFDQPEQELDTTLSQLPLADCKYFLYGGDSFSPTNSATNLDISFRYSTTTYQAPSAYTTAGAVSAIIDGGWRAVNNIDNQQDNQFQTTSAGAVSALSDINGFFDLQVFSALSASFDPATQEAWWLPDWSHNGPGDPRRFPLIEIDELTTDPDKTFTFNSDVTDGALNSDPAQDGQWDRALNIGAFPLNPEKRRSAAAADFQYVIADGGWWYQGSTTGGSASPRGTFFRTRCDKASYILARYGSTGKPEFGNHIFACKMFEITNDPRKYIKNKWGPGIEITQQHQDEINYALERGPLNATSFRNPIQWKSGTTSTGIDKKIQFFGTQTMLDSWLIQSNRAGLAIPGVRDQLFDYLTTTEFEYMRTSTIDGAGNRSELDGSPQFTFTGSLTTTPPAYESRSITGSTLKWLGDPDVFYYVSGGEVQFTDPEGGVDTSLYNELSSYSGYIRSNGRPENPLLIDLYNTASQFPQIPWYGSHVRDYTISTSEYNALNCVNVSEYRRYSGNVVIHDTGGTGENSYYDDNKGVSVTRQVSYNHPTITLQGLTFESKRGYFPPPVGHLRRIQTHPSAAAPGLRGSDQPILNNFLPASGGFYVHDVWDGAGFVFQRDADQIVTQDDPLPSPIKTPEKDPTLIGDTDNTISDPCQGKEINPSQGVLGWWYDDTLGTCVPITDTNNNWIWVFQEGEIVVIQVDDDDPRLLSFSGGSETVILDDGTVLNKSCGDYTGFGLINSRFSDGPDRDIPFVTLSKLVKRATDSEQDMCVIKNIPTLWTQKHKISQQAPITSANMICRNVYNEQINRLEQLMPDLSNQFINVADGSVIKNNRALIDMDVVQDVLILRQQPTDTNINIQSYVFDRVSFNYDTGNIKLGQHMTHHVTTDGTPNTQLICHYYNEDDNCVMVGRTVDSGDNHIYPELYKLDLTSYQWSQVFPAGQSTDDFRIDASHFDDIPCQITRVDPGEMSYNTVTNNYNVTYLAAVSSVSGTTPVIFSHVFENRPDHMELISANMFHSEDKSIQTDAPSPEASLTFRRQDDTITGSGSNTPVDIYSGSFDNHHKQFTLSIRPALTNNNDALVPIRMEIDWGDGEQVKVESDISNKDGFSRYGPQNNKVYLSKNTVLVCRYYDPHLDGHLDGHLIQHHYIGMSAGTHEITIKVYMNDGEPPIIKKYRMTTQLPDIDADDIRLINTRFFSSGIDADDQQLLLTFETQATRHITHSKIDFLA